MQEIESNIQQQNIDILLGHDDAANLYSSKPDVYLSPAQVSSKRAINLVMDSERFIEGEVMGNAIHLNNYN